MGPEWIRCGQLLPLSYDGLKMLRLCTPTLDFIQPIQSYLCTKYATFKPRGDAENDTMTDLSRCRYGMQ